jgi:signal transduction histidine kinase/ActR/RegA family two-component response regulator
MEQAMDRAGSAVSDARLRLVLSILVPVAGFYSLFYFLIYLVTGSERLLPPMIITVLLLGAFLKARSLAKADRITESALWVGYALAATPVGVIAFIPFVYPTLVMMPLAAGALVIAYVEGRALVRFLVVCGLSSMLAGFIGTLSPPETEIPPWMAWVVLYGTIGVSVVVILSLLWLSSRRLREIMARLRQADRFKDDFLSVLGHELRTPLASVANASTLLKEGERGEAQLPELIHGEARHMARLLDDLLDVTRIKRGTLALQESTVDLSEIVAQVVASARTRVASSGQVLKFACEPRLSVRGDAVRLVQVVSNLLTNALRYTPSEGTITVSLARVERDALITVQDTGIGFDEALHARLFEPFVQGPPLPGQLPQGLGVGLALVQQLVERHHGTVRAHSDGPGKGARFEVRLPLLNADEQRRPEGQLQSAASTSQARVLVVDDSKNAALTLSMLVKTWGHETNTAFDAPAALELAETWRPEVVLLDLGLPTMDGIELGKLLREKLGPELLLFAVTGYGSEEHRERTRAQGFAGYFLKPIVADELATAITNGLRSRK